MTIERAGAVLFGGQPMTLVGPELKVGDEAPDVELVDNHMARKKISSVKANVKIISCIVSLDTGVCADETNRFKDAIGEFGAEVVLINVSRDLPFAQQKFCGASSPSNVIFLSDYATGAFGYAYGTWIKEVALDSRAVFVVDAHNKIAHVQYVKDTPTHPNYEAVLAAVRALV